MYLAQNLRYLREQKGLSQRECAEIFGLSGSAIAMWEQDQRKPDIEMIVRLAEYFDVSLDELVLKDLKPPIPLYALNLRYLREKQELTQQNMADFLGYRGKQGYSMVETGKSGISVESLVLYPVSF